MLLFGTVNDRVTQNSCVLGGPLQVPKYIPQFDQLRALAVLLVMLFHASHHVAAFPMATWLSFGWVGVDLFFVLSGFLITGVLLESRDQARYFVNFYTRRILRIWPLYFALLAVMFEIMPRLAPHWSATAMKNAHPAWAFVLFVQNLTTGHDLTGPLSVTWSLAIEEQFYLVWPLLIWLLPRDRVRQLALVLILGSPLLRLLLNLAHTHVDVYFNTMTRLDGLAVGSFLAIWLPEADPSRVKRSAMILLPMVLTAAITIRSSWIQYSTIALSAGAIVSLSLFVSFRSAFLVYTGRISYGLYLVHLALFGLATKPELRRFYPRNAFLNDLAYVLTGLALSYGLASLSWFAYEKQILRAKSWFTPDREKSLRQQPNPERADHARPFGTRETAGVKIGPAA
jgi:peptidoglycan/LPS O-acetylase OafA/YrhL